MLCDYFIGKELRHFGSRLVKILGNGYTTGSSLVVKYCMLKNQIFATALLYAIIILSCSLHKYQTFHNFRAFVRSVAVRALESYTAGSGFKVQWSHFYD